MSSCWCHEMADTLDEPVTPNVKNEVMAEEIKQMLLKAKKQPCTCGDDPEGFCPFCSTCERIDRMVNKFLES